MSVHSEAADSRDSPLGKNTSVLPEEGAPEVSHSHPSEDNKNHISMVMSRFLVRPERRSSAPTRGSL